MKTGIIHTWTGAFIIAGMITTFLPADAQSQQANKQATQQANRHSDGEFVRRVSQENLAIIELSKLASQKASSSEVRNFAKTMIDEHSRAKGELASILEKSRIVTDADSYRDEDKEVVGMGKGTEADTNTGSGVGLNDKEGVETGHNTGTGIDDPTGSASDSRINSTVKPGVPTGTDMKTGLGTGEIPTTSEVVTQSNEIAVNLSSEHKAQYDKLAKLTGSEFDRQYIDLMAKEHDKIVKLHEQQARHGRNDLLKQYAVDAQPMARDHKEKAMQMKTTTQSNKKANSQKRSNP